MMENPILSTSEAHTSYMTVIEKMELTSDDSIQGPHYMLSESAAVSSSSSNESIVEDIARSPGSTSTISASPKNSIRVKIDEKKMKRNTAHLITMDNDRNCLLHAGYTFFFRYRLFKRGQKWVCTNFPRCKAYLCVDDDFYIVECMTQHNHIQKSLHLCPNGKYVKTRMAAYNINKKFS
ncbi:uncharacterized protein [Maniola hyperantus]|uniref:uncharacterized protein isoform X3 n=1 Tax=Aphantopus hyperantus TaxID=2795564 RepID=UPI0037483CF2